MCIIVWWLALRLSLASFHLVPWSHSARLRGAALTLMPRGGRAVFSIYRDFPGILIVLILKTSGMGKWYSWDFDCLIFREPF